MMKIKIKDLLDAGIHFGHRKNRWNPKMSEYIFGHRNGIHIIDLQKTVILFNEALKAIQEYASQGKNILFIGTKRQASEIIEKYALAVTPAQSEMEDSKYSSVELSLQLIEFYIAKGKPEDIKNATTIFENIPNDKKGSITVESMNMLKSTTT